MRHIESMIRMSEASARMQLRENVRSDDVDLAIRVMLNSFINAQKYSVMKQMKKVSPRNSFPNNSTREKLTLLCFWSHVQAFSKYLTAGKDYHELLDYVLSSLIKTEVTYYHLRHDRDTLPTSVTISCDDFEQKVSQLHFTSSSSIVFNLFSPSLSQARELNIHDVRSFYETMGRQNRVDGRNLIHTF